MAELSFNALENSRLSTLNVNLSNLTQLDAVIQARKQTSAANFIDKIGETLYR
jgi:hypothetical protein